MMAWDQSLELFEDERYVDAFLKFMDYLADPAQNNVTVDVEQGRVAFYFYQGSKLISGYLDGKKVRALKAGIITGSPFLHLYYTDHTVHFKKAGPIYKK